MIHLGRNRREKTRTDAYVSSHPDLEIYFCRSLALTLITLALLSLLLSGLIPLSSSASQGTYPRKTLMPPCPHPPFPTLHRQTRLTTLPTRTHPPTTPLHHRLRHPNNNPAHRRRFLRLCKVYRYGPNGVCAGDDGEWGDGVCGGLVLDVWGWGEGEEEWVVDEGAEKEEEVSVSGERGRGEG